MARALRASGVVLIVLGLTVLQFVAYELWGTSMRANAKQNQLSDSLDRALGNRQLREPPLEARPPVTELPRAGADGVIAWGRIHVPKIDLTRVVVEGATRSALMNGPGHYPGTPLPGAVGPVGIAGHRTTWGAPFHNLDKLKRGDLVIIQTAAGRYRYKVTRSVIVSPQDTEVLQGDPESDAKHKLTLTTCEPKYSAAKRLIVWADLASWQVAS